MLPRHEHVVEDDVAIRLVETAAERIVERIAGAQRERAARVKLQAGRIDRHHQAIGIILVARLQRMDAAQVKIVRQRAAGGELLRARNHDAVVALLHDAGVKRGIALPVRRLGAVDLRRHDRIAEIEMMLARVLVERHQIVGKFLATRGENTWRRREPAEETGHVVERAPHQAERGFRPRLRRKPSRAEIRMGCGDLIGAQHRLPRARRRKRHPVAPFGLGRDIVEPGDRARRLAKRRMRRHVGDPPAVDEDGAAVIE